VTKWCSIVAAIATAALMVGYPIYTSSLASGGPAAHQAGGLYSGASYTIRLMLLGVVVLMLGLVVYHGALRTPREHPNGLGRLLVAVLVIAFTSELVGRALHYASLARIGI
jgi:anaerobic dimethyl sulfoxide reductase subunit C (anchor subunit)